MTLLLSFAALLPRLLLGLCLVHLIWKTDNAKAFVVKIFLSAGVGFGVSSLFSFLWIWVGLPLAMYAILESLLALALAVWMLIAKRPRFIWDEKPNLLWTVFLALGVFLFALNLAFYALEFPHGRPDAWINWNVVARFVYLGGADWQATFVRQWDHPDYPFLMAMTNAITWFFVRETSTWGPIAFHTVIALSTAGLLFALINYFRDFKQAVLTTVMFASMPFIVDQSMRQYADLLLAYLILGAGGLTILYLQTRDLRLPIFAGLLIGLGGWAKNEGLPAIMGLSLGWLWLARQKEMRPAFKNYLLGLALPLIVIVLFKLLLAPSNDLMSAGESSLPKLFEIDRYLTILQKGGETLWYLGSAPIPLIGLIILMAILLGRSESHVDGLWLIVVVIGFQLAVYFGIYLLTPLDLEYHLRTSLDRLYMHVLPLALLGFFLWLRSPQIINSKES